MLMEANIANDYKELPTKIVENGNMVNGKASPEHSMKFVSTVTLQSIDVT